MDVLSAIVIGVIQGLTEFLPISSSAHLIFFQEILGMSQANLAFDTFLHLGTVLAVVVYFFKDIVKMIKAFISSIFDLFESSDKFKEEYRNNSYKKLSWLIIIGTIPAGIVGILFKDIIDTMFQSGIVLPAFFLLVTGILLFISQKINRPKRNFKDFNVKNVLLIGLMEGLAIIPGISRSGATISAGLLQNFNKDFIAKFSFILAIPAILGATLVQINDISLGLNLNLIPYILGFVAAAFSGYLAISLLLKIIRKRSLNIFAYYCWILGIAILIYSIFFV